MMATRQGAEACLRPQVVDKRLSADGSCKYLLRLHDGKLIETVAMPHEEQDAPDRLTVCFSTQVGCAMGCAFCATGGMGFTRNLEAAEMVWQLQIVEDDFGRRAGAAIAMGQGEPLRNYRELKEALRILNSTDGPGEPGIDEGNLAVSTCGILEAIRSLASDGVSAVLAVSLHAARQELRDELMPGVRAFPLHVLHDELERYCEATCKAVTVQYLMLDGVNDGDEDLEALARFCRGLDARVTLLHFNPVEGIPHAPSSFGRMALWSMGLEGHGIKATVNKPRGADVDAACGQLANRSSG